MINFIMKIVLWEATFGKSRIAMQPRQRLTIRRDNAIRIGRKRRMGIPVSIRKVWLLPAYRSRVHRCLFLKCFHKRVLLTSSNSRRRFVICKILKLWAWSTVCRLSLTSQSRLTFSKPLENNFFQAKRRPTSRSSSCVSRKRAVPNDWACYSREPIESIRRQITLVSILWRWRTSIYRHRAKRVWKRRRLLIS